MSKTKKGSQRKKVIRNPETGKFVIRALENRNYDYRTAEGIAKEVRASIDDVKLILNSDSRVRISVMKSKSGNPLYTLKIKKSAVGDIVTAFRAMNSDKLGDS